MEDRSTSIIIPQKIPPIKWSDDSERLILYADIMGFSYRINKTNHDDLKKTLLKFKKEWARKIKPLQQSDHLRSVQFSDSILLVANGVNEKMFNLLTKASVCLMQLALKNGFPIKGVIAQGNFTYDKENELYFGLPLVEASNLHDELNYYGIVVHHSAEKTVKSYSDAARPYAKIGTYLKKGTVSHYNLSWHLLDQNLSKGNLTKLIEQWLEKIEENVSGAPRIYVDNTRRLISKSKSELENSEDESMQ